MDTQTIYIDKYYGKRVGDWVYSLKGLATTKLTQLCMVAQCEPVVITEGIVYVAKIIKIHDPYELKVFKKLYTLYSPIEFLQKHMFDYPQHCKVFLKQVPVLEGCNFDAIQAKSLESLGFKVCNKVEEEKPLYHQVLDDVNKALDPAVFNTLKDWQKAAVLKNLPKRKIADFIRTYPDYDYEGFVLNYINSYYEYIYKYFRNTVDPDKMMSHKFTNETNLNLAKLGGTKHKTDPQYFYKAFTEMDLVSARCWLKLGADISAVTKYIPENIVKEILKQDDTGSSYF